MPDTGAPWNIPYVAGTDLVADWPTDNQTMAEAIANALDLMAIRQVVSTTKTDTFSHSFASAGGSQQVTGLSASITPASTANKVLVTVHVSVASSGGEPTGTGIILKRAGTAISVGDAASNRTSTTGQQSGGGSMSISNVAVTFLDSPSTTSATSYTVDVFNADVGNRVIYVNRSSTDADSVGYGRSTSSITLMEVGA